MTYNQNPFPGVLTPGGIPAPDITPGVGPPETPQPVVPDEQPVTNPPSEAPGYDPAPERNPVNPGIPELNFEPIPGTASVYAMK